MRREAMMREPRDGQERRADYLVLNRSCADLYDEVASLFTERPDIEVVLDRRRGKGKMAAIPVPKRSRVQSRQKRRVSLRSLSVELRKGAP
jgi:hypothetical protein